MHALTLLLLTTLMAQGAPPADAKQGRAPQTDQTVPVSRGTRLAINNFAGEVVIRAWDKDAVRVQARSGMRAKVNVRTEAGVLSIDAAFLNSKNASVDYEISAPAWMPMNIEGQYDFVTVEGIQAEVSITTVRGDIVLKGTGPATAKTIEGAIEVDGARGKTTLSSVNEDITVSGGTGDIVVDTTNGSITLSRIASSNVEVTTVNGDVTYAGALADKGHYSFSTHNGDITVTVPDTANATFNVRTYNGEFGASLPVKGPDTSTVRRGKRVTYTLGNGSAVVEMETFGGDIRLRRAGANRSGRDNH
jgi:DUF4097 and DUF4098 domain-containing protein YvlB